MSARLRGKLSTVERTLTLPEDEFEEFLAHDRSSAYQIVINTPDALYEAINLPPVKPKLIGALVQSEVRRLYTSLPPFSLAFRPIEDVFQDGKTMKRIACCMVSDEFLESVLTPFMRHNKPVSRIISLPAILAHLVCSGTDNGGETILCSHDGGLRKTIFLQEKGCVTLVRHVPSDAPGWDQHDLQHVSMTMDYCFQSLRVRPSQCLALNGGEAEAPLKAFDSPLVQAFSALRQEYLPLLAALNISTSDTEDLRPAAYRAEHRQQTLLNRGMLAFSAGAALSATFLAATLFSVISLGSDIEDVRRHEQTLQTTLTAHQQARQNLGEIEPLIAMTAALRAEPSLPALLAALPGPPPSPLQLTAMKAEKSKEAINLILSGTVSEQSYAAMQNHFETLCTRLQKINGMRIISKQLNTTARTFILETAQTP
jgi:hypothetical protein